MIYGSGDIASILTHKYGYNFFACGVSNRKPITDAECQRELNAILNTSKQGMFVYISTLSIYYADTPYTRHKLEMEQLIKDNKRDYAIVRVGNITWGNNPNTLINYLRNKIAKGEEYKVLDEYRYLIDEEDFLHWVDLIPTKGKHEMNITGKRLKVSEIAQLIKDGKL